MQNVNSIQCCEVCGDTALDTVLNLGSHPLCDDLIQLDESRQCITYPIEILYCKNCATAHQRFQISKQKLFPKTYHYRPRFTADVLNGMSDLVNACEEQLGSSLEGKLVLDIGCNDCSLLDLLHKKGAKTIGVEPTAAYLDGLKRGHILFNGFFCPELAKEILTTYGSPEVITFTNVFAHIENLPELINALKIVISPQTTLVIENHYLGSVLDRYQFDTFYHEHLRTYSLTSFQYIAKKLDVNLNVVEFPSRYGGNIRVFLGGTAVTSEVNKTLIESILQLESNFGKRLSQMQSQVEQWKSIMGARIHKLVSEYGPLSGKAFPGRAAILIQLLNLDVDMIEAVYEKPDSMKVGHYVPGTRIPIKSEDELFISTSPPNLILNLAWHISEEVHNYLKQGGYTGVVIDIIDPQDMVF
jgi:hypothetical protein